MTEHYFHTILTVHCDVMEMMKGFGSPSNPLGPSVNISSLSPLLGVKEGNPVLGTVSTDDPNGLNKNLNLVSQVNGLIMLQFSLRCTSSQQAGSPPLVPHSSHCSPRGLRNS